MYRQTSQPSYGTLLAQVLSPAVRCQGIHRKIRQVLAPKRRPTRKLMSTQGDRRILGVAPLHLIAITTPLVLLIATRASTAIRKATSHRCADLARLRSTLLTTAALADRKQRTQSTRRAAPNVQLRSQHRNQPLLVTRVRSLVQFTLSRLWKVETSGQSHFLYAALHWSFE